MTPARVRCWAAAALLLLPALASAFDFEDVGRRAAELATRAYDPPKVDLPQVLRDLKYDQYRDIRFRNERSLWRAQKLPFEVAFFHRGGMFKEVVKMNEVAEGQEPRTLAFNANDFDYGANPIDRARIRDIGYAGFRVHYNVNTPKYKD
ncbi:MAG TPA: glucan biosynthesis protein, partial [Usitatibacter sp.]